MQCLFPVLEDPEILEPEPEPAPEPAPQPKKRKNTAKARGGDAATTRKKEEPELVWNFDIMIRVRY